MNNDIVQRALILMISELVLLDPDANEKDPAANQVQACSGAAKEPGRLSCMEGMGMPAKPNTNSHKACNKTPSLPFPPKRSLRCALEGRKSGLFAATICARSPSNLSLFKL